MPGIRAHARCTPATTRVKTCFPAARPLPATAKLAPCRAHPPAWNSRRTDVPGARPESRYDNAVPCPAARYVTLPARRESLPACSETDSIGATVDVANASASVTAWRLVLTPPELRRRCRVAA